MKMTIRFYKLKQRCDKSNGSCNWSSTKSSSLHGTKLQICEHSNQFNDDLTFVDPSLSQQMRFTVFHNVQKDIDPNSTHHWKGLIMYKDHGTTTMNFHVASKHTAILNKYNTWHIIAILYQKTQTCSKAILWRLGVIHY